MKCKDDPKHLASTICDTCNGDGLMQCNECEGERGEMEGVAVRDTGSYDSVYRTEDVWHSCDECEGEGKVKCETCDGDGAV